MSQIRKPITHEDRKAILKNADPEQLVWVFYWNNDKTQIRFGQVKSNFKVIKTTYSVQSLPSEQEMGPQVKQEVKKRKAQHNVVQAEEKLQEAKDERPCVQIEKFKRERKELEEENKQLTKMIDERKERQKYFSSSQHPVLRKFHEDHELLLLSRKLRVEDSIDEKKKEQEKLEDSKQAGKKAEINIEDKQKKLEELIEINSKTKIPKKLKVQTHYKQSDQLHLLSELPEFLSQVIGDGDFGESSKLGEPKIISYGKSEGGSTAAVSVKTNLVKDVLKPELEQVITEFARGLSDGEFAAAEISLAKDQKTKNPTFFRRLFKKKAISDKQLRKTARAKKNMKL
jgi:hypothetical protein